MRYDLNFGKNFSNSDYTKKTCKLHIGVVAYSLTDPLNFLIFLLDFDYDYIWSGMQMKMLINTLSSL